MSEFSYSREGFLRMYGHLLVEGIGERAVAGQVRYEKGPTKDAVYALSVEPPAITQILVRGAPSNMAAVSRLGLNEQGEPHVQSGCVPLAIELGSTQQFFEKVTGEVELAPVIDERQQRTFDAIGENVMHFEPFTPHHL